MQGMLVAIFELRSQADAARAALLERGFQGRQLAIEGGDTQPDSDERGLAGVIARMFSGLRTPPDARAHDYAEIVARGGCVLVLHGVDDAAAARATSILVAHGAKDVQAHGLLPAENAGSGARDARVQREIAAVSSVGPQVHALPNAPTDWDRTGGHASPQRMTGDPAKPRGELSGTDDLGPEADRDMLERRRKRR
jgi:hypothetical protein